MNFFKSALFGAVVAVGGTFLHNAYRPIGLVIALVALFWGIVLVRTMYRAQSCNLAYGFAWVAVIIRASTLGNGGELLIQANNFGNLFAFGGALILILSLFILKIEE